MKRLSRTIILQALLMYCIMAGSSHTAAYAASTEVQSIQIFPVQTTIGKYPYISGRVKMIKTDVPGREQEINVIAVLYRPDNIMKSWTWMKVRMRSGETKPFAMPQKYDLSLPGTYKVDYNVYTKDMRPLHRLSRTFVADDPAHPSGTATLKEKDQTGASSSARLSQRQEHRYLGIGLYGNALNPAGGASMLLWPFKYIGIQGIYTDGTFTSAEGRLLIRFPLSSGINPYFGAGYLDVLKDEEIIGVDTRFRDNGVSGVIGAQWHLSRSVYAYAELSVSGTSIELEKQVSNGGSTVDAKIDYAPATICIGIVYFLF